MLQATADAMEAIHAAYWHPSDTEGLLIDPAGLVAQDSALHEAFDVSLGVEVFARVNCTESYSTYPTTLSFLVLSGAQREWLEERGVAPPDDLPVDEQRR